MKDQGGVLEILRRHQGRDKAITKAALAAALRLTPRRVEACIRDLIVEHGVGIASACDPPAGYFIIGSRDEAMRYRAQLISRMRKLNQRLYAVDSALARRIQGELFS